MMQNPHPAKRRVIALLAFFGAFLLLFAVVLYDAQILHGGENRAKSISSNAASETVTASRGIITDRNGKVLVSNRLAYTLVFDRSGFDDDAALNAAILRLVQLCEETGTGWNDTLPIGRVGNFLRYSNARSETFDKFIEKNDLTSGASGRQLLSELRELYRTGRGGVKVRSRWRYDKQANLIEIYEIPYSTSIEAILDKVAELIKAGKISEISDMRDETDLSGLKLAIDLKRSVDPEKLMTKLFRLTPLQDTVSCNFNILIAGMPRVMGVGEILNEWTAWRTECVRRRVYFVLNRKKDKLHLLLGLKRILLDIDKAIAIIRETEEEAEVIPNLMIGFGIDQVQAEYVAEIKLRNINKEYILKRVQETEDLQKEIADLEDTLQKPARIRKIIVGELEQVRKKYAVPRRTEILYGHEVEEYVEDDQPEDYPVTVFLSREGYFKKITPKSLRMSGEQKYKEGDGLRQQMETSNNAEIMFFTDRCQVYKTRVSEFGDSKASVLGDYLPGRLAMDEGERVIFMVLPGDYSGCLLFFYENGKAARVELSAYATVSNRRKLTGAYSDKSPLVSILPLPEDRELALVSTEPRALLVHTSLLAPKTTRNVQGVAVMTLKPKYHLDRVLPAEESGIVNLARYRTRTIPAAGAILKPEDRGEEQLTLL